MVVTVAFEGHLGSGLQTSDYGPELSFEPLVPIAVDDGIEEGGAEPNQVTDAKDDDYCLSVIPQQLIVDVHQQAESIQGQPTKAEA